MDWLCKADGFVFVIDSQEVCLERNIEQLVHLNRDLLGRGVNPTIKPVVFQANKRDLPYLSTMEFLRSKFTAKRCAYVESVATEGVGTLEAVALLCELMAEP